MSDTRIAETAVPSLLPTLFQSLRPAPGARQLAFVVVGLAAVVGCPVPPEEPAAPVKTPREQILCAYDRFVTTCPTRDRLEPLGDRGDSVRLFVEGIDPFFDAPGLVIDQEQLQACLSALDNCEAPLAGDHPCDAARLFHGDKTAGESCEAFDCARGLFCMDGVCGSPLEDGDPCEAAVGCGDPGLVCVPEGTCVRGPRALRVGDACDLDCPPGLACVDSVCVAQIPVMVGDTCDAAFDATRAHRYCVNQQSFVTYCKSISLDGVGVCTEGPRPGERCETTVHPGGLVTLGICWGARPCDQDTNTCLDGSVELGGACDFTFDCPLGARCDLASGVCVAEIPRGQACHESFECTAGLGCVDSVCGDVADLCE